MFFSCITLFTRTLGFACIISIIFITASDAGMPPMNPQELAEFEKFMQELEKPEMQQFIKEFEAEFNKLPPDVQEELNKQAMEDLKRMGIDPYSYQPMASPAPAPTFQPVGPKVQTPPQLTPSYTDPVSDCSQVATHSLQQASALLQNTISYLEIVRQKLSVLTSKTTTVQEWLSTLAYYVKMMNKPEHVRRFTSVTFAHLYDLITDLELLLRNESGSLIILAGEGESRSDDPYAILGIPCDATDEEIAQAYNHKFTENDPAALKKELEQLKVDATKIAKRMKQATLQQATLADAYEQLQNPNLRQQLDRYRSNTQKQQLTLRTANSQSMERLHKTLDQLIQQGLIKELEDFFARYAPTELTYRQNMEDAEKGQHAEQQRPPPLLPLPSPLGSGFPYNGYQPQPYYPQNYFPQSYQPTFTPQSIAPGQNTGLKQASSPQPSTGTPTKSDKPAVPAANAAPQKKEPVKADATKKAPKAKKKKNVDGTEQLAKEFGRHLGNLKEPMNNFKDYMQTDEQGGTRTLDVLSAPRTRASRSITDEHFKPLHEGLKRHINPPFINKFETIRKFIVDNLIPNQVPNQKAIDACRSVWEKHHKEHTETYKILSIICRHTLEAVEKNRLLAQQIPWNNVLTVCQTIEGMKELFKKPGVTQTTSAPGKQGSIPLVPPVKPSSRERDAKIKEKGKKEKNIPTLEQTKSMVQTLKAGYEIVEKNIQQSTTRERLGPLLEQFNSALAQSNLEEVLKVKNEFDTLLSAVGFNELIQVQSMIKKAQKTLPPADKEIIARLLKDAKICRKLHPALYELQSFHKAMKEFLRSAPEKNEGERL